MKKIVKWGIGCVGLVVIVLALMIAFGSTAPPPPMHSVIDVLAAIDRSDQPPISRFPARDACNWRIAHIPLRRTRLRSSFTVRRGTVGACMRWAGLYPKVGSRRSRLICADTASPVQRAISATSDNWRMIWLIL